LQKYQKFLKDTNIKIFIKYDGERTKNYYTVKVFDKKETSDNWGHDTDNPEKLLDEILSDLKCDCKEEVNGIIFKAFQQIEKKIRLRAGNESVISFLIDYVKGDALFTLFLKKKGKFINYSNNNLREIIEESKRIVI